jgi:hypothetical protein
MVEAAAEQNRTDRRAAYCYCIVIVLLAHCLRMVEAAAEQAEQTGK